MSRSGFFEPVPVDQLPPEIDTTKPHPARVYDYWLGGKDNFPPDRQVAEYLASVYPAIRTGVRENRAFLRRAVTFLTEAGIRQFLDIGTGIPTANNTHEVAQRLAPEARIVYSDNDPIVLAHARALLTSTPEGATAYLDADIRDPDAILGHPGLQRTLDLSQPTALMLLMTLQLVDAEDIYGIVNRLVSALVSGSYVVISHPTSDFVPPEVSAKLEATYTERGMYFKIRNREEFERFFAGLEFIPPGITPIAEWRAENEPQPRPDPADASAYAAVARKP